MKIKTTLFSFYRKYPLVDLLILLFFVLICFSELATGQASLKWDATDLYLPWKFFVTETLKSGELPLWNPSMNYGFSQMGDPGTWYPISWFIGLLGRYNLSSLNIEFLFHIWLAGVSMYTLAKGYKISRCSSLLIGISFMFSGFFIGNAQHIGWLVSAAWFPLAFHLLRRITEGANWKHICWFSLVFFLMLSGGYPGIFITSCYIFFFYSVATLVRLLIKKKNSEAFQIFKSLSAVVFCFLSVSSVVIISSVDLARHLTRSAGLSLGNTSWNIFHGSLDPKSLVSLILPYAVSLNSNFWEINVCFLNSYAGSLTLVLIASAFLVKKLRPQVSGFLYAALLFLFLSLGEHLPVRELSSHLPGMNLFRYPSLFRFLFILFLLLAAGRSLDFIKKEDVSRKTAWIITAILGALLLITSLILQTQSSSALLAIDSLNSRFIFQSLFMGLALMCLCILLFLLRSKPQFLIPIIGVFIISDMIYSAKLNLPYTATESHNIESVDGSFSKMPKAYPIPELKNPMNLSSEKELAGSPEFVWRNLATYHKMPSGEGFSPYGIKGMKEGLAIPSSSQFPELPFLFFLNPEGLNEDLQISSFEHHTSSIARFTEYSANNMNIESFSYENQIVIIQQVNDPNWKISIDGIPKSILTINELFMGFELTKGTHKIELEFHPRNTKIGFWYSLFSFLTLLLIPLISLKRSR